MAINNISGGAPAPQHRDGVFSLLAEMDQASVENYLLVSEERSDPLPVSPFNGWLLRLHFDPSEVLSLVDEIWPARWWGHHGRGRKPEDPLPLVCFLLGRCDTEYGTVFDLSEAYRHLERDGEYRKLCGYERRNPSVSVFRGVYRVMVENWPRFQACVAEAARLQDLLRRLEVDHTAGPDHSDEGNVLVGCGMPSAGWDQKGIFLRYTWNMAGSARFPDPWGAGAVGQPGRLYQIASWRFLIPPEVIVRSGRVLRTITTGIGGAITGLKRMRRPSSARFLVIFATCSTSLRLRLRGLEKGADSLFPWGR